MGIKVASFQKETNYVKVYFHTVRLPFLSTLATKESMHVYVYINFHLLAIVWLP